MFKHVNFKVVVKPGRYSKNEVEIVKTPGTSNTYTVKMGSPERQTFHETRDRRREFSQGFFEKFNEVADHDDRFDLSNKMDHKLASREIVRHMREGTENFTLKVRE